MLQIKIVEPWILYKKVSARICLSPPGVALEDSKDWHLLKYYNVQKRESRFPLGFNGQKKCIISKHALNKSCWALNSVQKSQWAHMCTSLQSGARGLQRPICFKYYIVSWNGKVDSVWGSMLPKIRIKRLQIKVAEH